MITKEYIVGFLDADGTITYGYYNGCLRVRVQIANTFRPVLDLIREVVGYGCIYENKSTVRAGYKRSWQFSIQAFDEVIKFLEWVFPLLIVKKEKASKALKEIKEYKRRTSWKDFDKNEVTKLYEELGSLRAVGRKLGITHKTVRKILDDGVLR